MVEAMWRVKLVANKKSDVAREITSAAEKLWGLRGRNPQETWEFTHSQDSDGQKLNGNQHLGLDDNEEEEMMRWDEDYDDD